MIPAIACFNWSGRHFWALVTNRGSNSISPINLSNPMVPTKGTDLTVGASPFGVAISPNGLFALVANYGSASISPINLSNPMVPTKGTDLTVGASPYSLGPNTIYFR